MKKLLSLTFLGFILWMGLGTHHAFAAGCTGTGACYWVGGTGNVNSTTNWATTSGGATTGGLPGSGDDCHFDAASNTTAYTVTFNVAANCNNLLVDAQPSVSGVVTLSISNAPTIAGNLTLFAGTVWSGGGATLSGTGTQTFTAASVNFTNSNFTFSGASASWTFADGLVGNGVFTLNGSNASYNFNAKTHAIRQLSTNGNTMTIDISNCTIGAIFWTMNGTGKTLTKTSSQINITSANGTFAGGGLTYNNVSFTQLNNGTASITDGGNSFNNLTFTVTNSTRSNITIGGNQTITGTFTSTGLSATQRVIVKSTVIGTARTLTVSSAPSLTDTVFQDVTASGSTPWTGTRLGDALGNTGITFATGVPKYWISGTGSWSDTAHWSLSDGGASGAAVPLPQDNVFFTANSVTSGSQTITMDMPHIGLNIDFTGLANSPSFTTSSGDHYFYGSWTGSSVGTAAFATSGQDVFESQARSSVTFTQGTMTINCGWRNSTVGGTLTLNSAMTLGTAFAGLDLNAGTFNANNFNVSATLVITGSSSTVTRTITMGSGTWTVTTASAGSARWNITSTTGLTLNANTSTIKYTDTTNTANVFAGGSLTYNNLWFSRGASTGDLTIQGSNTFNDFKDDGTVAHSIKFTAATTQHVTTFSVSGTSGNLISINSNTTATHALVKDGAGTICSDYLNIQHSVATPASTWYAGANSTNNQATATAGSGWTFTACPATGSIIHKVSLLSVFFSIGGGLLSI